MRLNALLTFSAITILFVSSNLAQTPSSVKEDELKKYVFAQDSINKITVHIKMVSDKLAKGNKDISAARYNKLNPIMGSPEKLTEEKATPEEIAYLKKAQATSLEEMNKFRTSYVYLVSTYVGNDTYKKVRDALKTDPKLKKKYDSLIVISKPKLN